MLNLSRLVALTLAFTLGLSMGAGVLVGGVAIALGSFTVRDLENNGVPIPDEAFIGPNPEVDLLDLTILDFFDEVKALQAVGDDLTLDFLQKRYDLIFGEAVEELITDDARTTPIKDLFTKDGLTAMLSKVYIGNIEKYECMIDTNEGTVSGDPADENSYWVTAEGKKLSPLEEKIADFNLGDIIKGNINTDNILNELKIGEVLGYKQHEDGYWYDSNGEKVSGLIASFAGSTINTIASDVTNISVGELMGFELREDGKWYDSEGNKVSGVLTVFAGCTIDGVGDRMESAMLAELLGYEKQADGWYDSNGQKLTGAMAALAECKLEGENNVTEKINNINIGELIGYELKNGKWYQTDSNGVTTEVSGFMSKVASSNMNNVDGVFDTLVLSDIITERTGILSIIPENTGLANIDVAVTDTIKTTPMQYFINEGLIQFDNSSILDALCNDDIIVNKATYEKYYAGSGFSVAPNADGTYTIEGWRTQPLSNSFSYIVGLLTRNI